jgi:tryptophan-rich sensory protein
MKQYLFQLALCDEWCRVFIKEKRLGLGICVACAYSAAMVSLIITCVGMNRIASLLLLPSLLALIISTWLNLVLYCNRYTRNKNKRKPTTLSPIISL